MDSFPIEGFSYSKPIPHRVVNVDNRKDTPPPTQEDGASERQHVNTHDIFLKRHVRPWKGTADQSQERLEVDVSNIENLPSFITNQPPLSPPDRRKPLRTSRTQLSLLIEICSPLRVKIMSRVLDSFTTMHCLVMTTLKVSLRKHSAILIPRSLLLTQPDRLLRTQISLTSCLKMILDTSLHQGSPPSNELPTSL